MNCEILGEEKLHKTEQKSLLVFQNMGPKRHKKQWRKGEANVPLGSHWLL